MILFCVYFHLSYTTSVGGSTPTEERNSKVFLSGKREAIWEERVGNMAEPGLALYSYKKSAVEKIPSSSFEFHLRQRNETQEGKRVVEK